MRRRVEADRPWVAKMGYARAVRVGNVIEVAGTAAADEQGRVIAVGDVEGQTRAALGIIGEALEELGGAFEDVVRTRVFLKDVTQWEAAGRAHGEVFADIRPANTTMEVGGFVRPEILVEVEATAILDD
jgi:enamine deaminase RidA (YjgF/YER057c/UK114 family)